MIGRSAPRSACGGPPRIIFALVAVLPLLAVLPVLSHAGVLAST